MFLLHGALAALFALDGRWRPNSRAGHRLDRLGCGEFLLFSLLGHEEDLTTKHTKEHREMSAENLNLDEGRSSTPEHFPSPVGKNFVVLRVLCG